MSDPTAPGGDAPAAQPAPGASRQQAPSSKASGSGADPRAQAPVPAGEAAGSPEPGIGSKAAASGEAGEQDGGAPDSLPPQEPAGPPDDASEDSPPESFAAASWAEQAPRGDDPKDDSLAGFVDDSASHAPEDLQEALPETSLEDLPEPAEQVVLVSDGPEPAAEPAEPGEPSEGPEPTDAPCGGCAVCPQAAAANAAAAGVGIPAAPAAGAGESAEPVEARPGEPAGPAKPARPSVIVRYGVMRNIGEFRHNVDPPPPRGAKVVVRTERGVELGEVVTPIAREGCACGFITAEGLRDFARNNGPEYPFRRDGRVLRVANPQDVIDYRHLQQSAREAAKYCRQEIRAMGTDMKLVTVEHLLGGERIIFYFASESRVDFRDLVRRLASVYRTRIEMRQVGARDEARLVADYERCGQQCCCQSYLKDLKPVSMRMAKTQKATLDPSKISGRCGRLMCCLRYEDIAYEELRKKLPRKNIFVRTASVVGKVVDTQIITQLVRLLLVDNTTVVVGNDEILERDVEAPIRPEVRVRPAPPPRGERVFLRTMAEGQPPAGSPPAGSPAAGPGEPGGPTGLEPAAVPAGANGTGVQDAIASPGEGQALSEAGPAADEAGDGQPREAADVPGEGPGAGRRGPEAEGGSAEGEGPGGKKRRRRRSRHKKGGPEGQGQGPGQGQAQGQLQGQGQGQGQARGQGPSQGQARGPRPPAGPQGGRQRGPRDDRQPRGEPNRQFAPQSPSQAAPDAGGGFAPRVDAAPAGAEDYRPSSSGQEVAPSSADDFRPAGEASGQADNAAAFGPADSGGPQQDFDDEGPGGESPQAGPAPAEPRSGPVGGPPQGQGQGRGQGQGGGQGRRRRRHRGGRRPPQ